MGTDLVIDDVTGPDFGTTVEDDVVTGTVAATNDDAVTNDDLALVDDLAAEALVLVATEAYDEVAATHVGFAEDGNSPAAVGTTGVPFTKSEVALAWIVRGEDGSPCITEGRRLENPSLFSRFFLRAHKHSFHGPHVYQRLSTDMHFHREVAAQSLVFTSIYCKFRGEIRIHLFCALNCE